MPEAVPCGAFCTSNAVLQHRVVMSAARTRAHAMSAEVQPAANPRICKQWRLWVTPWTGGVRICSLFRAPKVDQTPGPRNRARQTPD